MRRLFPCILFLAIFLIPSSLALHFDKQAGLVNGFLVDYRIPQISVAALIALLIIVLYLRTRPSSPLVKKTITVGIAVTMVFQSIVALSQFLLQRSVAGYWFLGEVSLHGQAVVRGEWINHTIRILPYGTTLHPNILAGTMVIFWLVWWKLERRHRSLSVLLLALTILICLLTQSLTAIAALLIGMLLFKLPALRSPLLALPLVSILFFANPSLLSSSNTSIQRRAQLEHIAFSMIHAHPLTGVGWNNFTLYQEQYGYVSSTTRFLQPVHNVFLLLVTELGVVGWIINGVLFVALLKLRPQWASLVGALMVLGSFDHYLLTLTTGRLLVLLVIALCCLAELIEKQLPPVSPL